MAKSINKEKTESPIKKMNESPAFIAQINWVSKSVRGYSKSDPVRYHVYISTSTHAATKRRPEGYKTLCLSFRDGIEEKITKSGYIMVGVCKNRLYFSEAAAVDGYKVSRRNGFTAGTAITLTEELEEVVKPFIKQEFMLKYDDFQELYYAEVEK